jgi:hypothetical protein
VRKNNGARACTLKFGDARKKDGVQVCTLKYGVVRCKQVKCKKIMVCSMSSKF